MSKRNLKSRRPLKLESLETRQMMAGDVTVTVANNEVSITGDNFDNSVQLGYDSLGYLEVKGLNNTRVNGGASYRVTGNWRDIGVVMDGGNDRLTINPPSGTTLAVPGTMLVYMGAGDDSIYFSALDVQGTGMYDWFNIEDAEDAYLYNVHAASKLHIAAPGSELMTFEAHGLDVDGPAVMHFDNASTYVTRDLDVVTLTDSTFNTLNIRTGTTVPLSPGGDVDSVTLKSVRFDPGGNLHIETGDDLDHVWLEDVTGHPTSGVDLWVDLGNGHDRMNVYDSSFEEMNIRGRGGNDAVHIESTEVTDRFFADLGSGNDRLDIYYSTIPRNFRATGGSGEDRMTLYMNSIGEFENERDHGFEFYHRKDRR